MDIRARWDSFDKARLLRLAKEGGWVIVGQVAAVLGALTLVRVLTEYLSPAQYGELALGLTVAALVNQVVMGGLGAGIGRFYSIASEKHDMGGYIRASRELMLIATVISLLIAAILLVGMAWLDFSRWMGLAAAALVFSILAGYSAALNSIQNAARQRAIVAIHGGLDAWLKIAFAFGIIICLGSTSTAVMVGYALSSFLITGSQILLLQRRISPLGQIQGNASQWSRQIWGYSWPFSVFGFFTWLHQASDRWALQSFATTDDTGLYAVVFQIGYLPIGLMTGMAMTFLGPILYQRSGNATDPARNQAVHQITLRITWACFSLTALVFTITFLLHQWLFEVLVAEEYRSFSYLLPWMVIAGGIFSAGQMLALKLMSAMKSSVMLTAKITTAILGLLLNLYGASMSGVEGVVIAQVVFSSIYTFWMAWLVQRRSNF